MEREAIKRILNLGWEEYKKSGWLFAEEITNYYRKRNTSELIAGLVCCNYTNMAFAKNYKDACVKQEAEVKQLKAEVENMKSYNRQLMERVKQLENDCKLLSGTDGTSNKKPSYREDVDTKAINSLLLKGYSKSEVAKKLGVSRQTIYRRLEEKSK